jgi:hypothetical protein
VGVVWGDKTLSLAERTNYARTDWSINEVRVNGFPRDILESRGHPSQLQENLKIS